MSMMDDLEENIRLLAAAQGNDKNVEQVLRLIPLDQLDVDPNQPRKLVGHDEPQKPEEEAANLAFVELRSSILEHGVLQPILVEPKGDRFQIIFGERRYRAARAARDLLKSEPKTPHRAGLDFSVIPAMVLVPGNRRLEIQLIENMHRLAMAEEEIGEALQRLKVQYGGNESAVARAIGRSIGFVQKMLFAGSDQCRALKEKWPDTEMTVLRKIEVLQRGGRSEDADLWPIGLEQWVNARVGGQIIRSEFEAEIQRLRTVKAGAALDALGSVPEGKPVVAYDPDEDDFERHWEESGGSPAPTAQAEPSPDIYEAGADMAGSVSSLEADYAPGQETRFDAEMERGRGGAAEVTSASTPLKEQVVTVKLELQPADAETLTTWLSDMQAKAKTDLELGVSVEVGVSVSMDAAMALIDAATGFRPDNMDLTPAMLREALMHIVKPA
ncbi:ParB N-terminal domain-containing protein [Acidithiobacillus ferrooxidans]|uniref:ParB/RepB/Spo0J family partition protein n=1 Tax=Acidithiobacillus ferrooxidans TaxID=920 RepID=UPI001C07BF7B|nr:ParB N-terminal domain-containing protein [Acidithiobacillus ferrooxidans]MBU2772691.1 ParB N-terminal domain-containing protein [Acidithiobacillus ferrooxidans]